MHRTPSNTSGLRVMAYMVELPPTQRLNRPMVIPAVSGRLRT
jgi:hypothetical protein